VFNFNNDVFENTQKLTPAVLQACDMLGMYQAELASVLGLQCADIGRMTSIQQFLIPGSSAWEKAVLFIRFYQHLYDQYGGNEVKMVHWLRADLAEFSNSPLLLMVDEGRLAFLLDYLSNQSCSAGKR